MKQQSMKYQTHRATRSAGVILTLAILAGCSGQQTKPGSDRGVENNALYAGQSTVVFLNQPKPASTEQAISMGDQAADFGRLDEALFHYIRGLEIDRNNADLLLRIASLHRSQGRLNQAALAYQQVLSTRPDNISALTGMGTLELKQNRYPQARQHLQRAVELDRNRVTAIRAETKPQVAAAELPEYDSQSPAQAYNGLGVLDDLIGNHSRAQQHYAAALTITPDALDVLNNQGYSYYLADQWPRAERSYRQILKLKPDYSQAWRNLGLVYARQQRYDAALDALMQIMPEPQAHNDLGYISMLAGDYSYAETAFKKAISLSPDYYLKAHENLQQLERMRTANTQAKR